MGPSKLWIVKDFAGMFCAMFTVLLILFADVAVCVMNIFPWYDYAITPQSLFFTVTYNAFLFMALWSHFTAMTSDPGFLSFFFSFFSFFIFIFFSFHFSFFFFLPFNFPLFLLPF